MIICGSYMFEFSVSKDIVKEVAVGKVATHLCLTITIKLGRVVTTLNV
jgi:hypothetical protein